jgi:hypothetical protein
MCRLGIGAAFKEQSNGIIFIWLTHGFGVVFLVGVCGPERGGGSYPNRYHSVPRHVLTHTDMRER